MKLEFSEEEIKQLLIDKAISLGIEANTVKIDASAYGTIRSATVWHEEEVPGKDEPE